LGWLFKLWAAKWASIWPGFHDQIIYKPAGGSDRSDGIMVSVPVSPDFNAE
jgi:hypothetical protein